MHYDTTRFVSASMHDVVVTLGEALLLVVAVVFIFLQSWRTTIIPTIAIPVSLIATLVVMKMLGFSLNMLSLLGMVLAIGLVVDDAIVVVENVERQLETGLKPLAAARAAMKEVTGPIIATTAVLMAVFVPVAFIPGVTGQPLQPVCADGRDFGRHFGLQFADAQPGAQRRLPAPSRRNEISRRSAGSTRASTGCRMPMRNGVRTLIRWRWTMLAAFVATLGATYLVSTRIPSTFLPVEDQGYFFVVIQLPDGASLERTDAVAKQVRDILQKTPGVDIVGSISGLNFLTSAAQSNSAVEFAILKPWDERPPAQSASKLVASVRPQAAVDPGCLRAELRSAVDPGPRRHRRLRIPGRGSDRTRQRRAQRRGAGRDRRGAQAAGDQRAAAVLVVQDLDAAVQLRPRPQQGEAARPQPAGRVQHAADLSRLALRQRLQPVRPHLPRDACRPTRMRAPLRPTCRDSMCATPPAAWCRSARSATLKPIVGPETVPHYNNYASALINGGAAPGYSSGQAVAAMERAAATALPRDFAYEWTGITYQELKAGSIATDRLRRSPSSSSS